MGEYLTDKQILKLQDYVRDLHGIAPTNLCLKDLLEKFNVKEIKELKEEDMKEILDFIFWWGREKPKRDGRKRRNGNIFRIRE